MNSLAIWDWDGGGVERGSESGMLNFIFHSQALLDSEDGVTCSQVSVVIILYFFRYSICFVLRNYKFMRMFFVVIGHRCDSVIACLKEITFGKNNRIELSLRSQ
jgi:hypothetical protein